LKSGTISRVKLRGFKDAQLPASAGAIVPASGQVTGAKFRLKPPSLAGGALLGDVLQLLTADDRLKHSPQRTNMSIRTVR